MYYFVFNWLYNWWAELDQAGAYFVTRLKANAAVEVIEQFSPSETQNTRENSHNDHNNKNDNKSDNENTPILTDQYIRFKHKKNSTRPNHYHNKTLRRITVKREGKEPLVLVSNNLTASAQEIAENYKQRWQIELLFKWLKQHLKLKRFLGRSACRQTATAVRDDGVSVVKTVPTMHHPKRQPETFAKPTTAWNLKWSGDSSSPNCLLNITWVRDKSPYPPIKPPRPNICGLYGNKQ